MPELERLAATLSSTEPLSFDERLLFAGQLLTQCRCDYDVIYQNEDQGAGRFYHVTGDISMLSGQ